MPPDNDAAYSQIETLKQRYDENPKGRVFALLADAYRKAGEMDRAEELILEGLESHPNYLSAYIVLGRINLDRERLAEAHEQFRKVLELDPENLIALKALGDLSIQTHRIDEATSWYERMLEIDQYNEEARAALGSLDQIKTESASTAQEVGASEEAVAEREGPGLPSDLDGPDAGGPNDSVSPESVGEANEAEALGTEAGDAGAEINLADMDSWQSGLIEDDEMDEEVELDWAGEDAGVVTETMAELYADQGLYEDAIKVYQELAAVRPYDERVQTRIRELTELLAGGGPSDSAADETLALPESEEPVPAPEPEAELTFPEPDTEPTLPNQPKEEIGIPEPEETVTTLGPEEAVALSEELPHAELEDAVALSELDVATLPDDAGEEIALPDPDEEAAIAEPEAGAAFSDLGATDAASVFGVQLSEGADLGEIDPFAGSFDALIMATQTGVSPDPDGSPLFPVEEDGDGAPAPAGPPAAGIAAPDAAATETIEDYLSRLLQYSPAQGGSVSRTEGQKADQTAASGLAEADHSTASRTSDENQSEDLAQFQAWLRSLKR